MQRLTLAKEVHAISIGEEDFYYADFDPPGMPDDGSVLDGRTISAATAEVMDGGESALEVVGDPAVVSVLTPINGRDIEAGTGVRVKVKANALMKDGAQAIIKVSATLSDGAVKNLGLPFIVEP